MTARPVFYRVRYEGGRFLGYGLPLPGTHGYPSTLAALEPDAACFDSPAWACEVALSHGVVPFTVEPASTPAVSAVTDKGLL